MTDTSTIDAATQQNLQENDIKGHSNTIQNQEMIKKNCFAIFGKHWKELHLSQSKVGSKSKTVFDLDWGWCFSDKNDAEMVVNKNSKPGKELQVKAWYSEIARRKWHGTKLEKKAAGLQTRVQITKQEIYKQDTDLRNKCHIDQINLDDFDKEVPNNLSDKQAKAYKILKPVFDELNDKKLELKKLEEDLEGLEKQIEEEANNTLTNPNDWPFHVLGYTNAREVILWHKGQLMPIKAKEIGEQDLKILCGAQYGESWTETRDAILHEAHRKGKIRIDDSIKTGVWKRECASWVIVSGKKALVVSEGTIKNLDTPVFDGRIIELNDDDWLDVEAFHEAWNLNESINTVFQELHELIRQWNWSTPLMSEFFTAFTFLFLVQQAMDWRPWLYITGSRGSAKTLLFEEVLSKIFKELCSLEGKTTAHAIAQTIGNTGKVPVLDEFEKNKRIDEILELLKGCNRGKGAKKKSGTTGDIAKSYTLPCTPIFASITMPSSIQKDSAQQTRTVIFEMKKPNQTIRLLTETNAKKLCARMLVVLLKNWELIQEKASTIRNNAKEIISTTLVEERTIDNFKYASGLLSLATGKEFTVPSWSVHKVEDDGDKILRTILSCKIKITNNDFEFVSSLLVEDSKYFTKLLEQNGIKRVHPPKLDSKPYLAINSDLVSKHLLRDDDYYRSIDVAAPLARIEEAIRSFDVKIGGSTLKCVLIPMHEVDRVCGSDSNHRNHAATTTATTKNNTYLSDNDIDIDIDEERGCGGCGES